MEPVKIVDNVYWVGALDFGIRDFHGYRTHSGTTYNAYLIIDEKVTLVDGVKCPFAGELLARVSKIIDPSKIDQVVSNHAELDHSGALPEIMQTIGVEKPIYASKMGEKALRAQMPGAEMNIKVVNSGESLSTGKQTLQFLETAMVHWPDSLFTFCPENGILYSQDAFGMHLASSRRFDDEVARNVWSYEALKYYANILTPLSGMIDKLLQKVVESGLLKDIKIIAPDHGIIWRQNPGEIVDLYATWVKQAPSRKAVIVYDSMWCSTEKMARALGDALTTEGVLVQMMGMKYNHRSDIATEMLKAGAVLVGSPTMNNDLYPTIAEILCYMRGLKFQNKVAAAFGSYGWSGEAPKKVQSWLEEMKYNTPVEPWRYNWAPSEKDVVPLASQMAKTIAAALPSEQVPPDYDM